MLRRQPWGWARNVTPHKQAHASSTYLFPAQELNETVGGKLEEYIHAINGCYPPEIVEYYSPNYSKILLDKIDEFQPIVA